MSRGFRKILLYILIITIGVAFAYRYDFYGMRQFIERVVFNVTVLDATLLNNRSVALREARSIFQTRIATGGSIDGSCLAEVLVPGWSFDVVHSPEIDDDKLLVNQCNNYLTGVTQYLIEYDTVGNFVQIKERASL